MPTKIKPIEPAAAAKIRPVESAIKVYDSPDALRSGGEARPLEYPHLYQIQAGEWRISYAVEHNRLAILVLEVLTPEGTVRKDPDSEKMTRKMKIKLLDWPEGSPSRDLPPEELGKKLKIKLLDLVDEETAARPERRPGMKIKFSNSTRSGPAKGHITLLDGTASGAGQGSAAQTAVAGADRKVTPLDEPTV